MSDEPIGAGTANAVAVGIVEMAGIFKREIAALEAENAELTKRWHGQQDLTFEAQGRVNELLQMCAKLREALKVAKIALNQVASAVKYCRCGVYDLGVEKEQHRFRDEMLLLSEALAALKELEE